MNNEEQRIQQERIQLKKRLEETKDKHIDCLYGIKRGIETCLGGYYNVPNYLNRDARSSYKDALSQSSRNRIEAFVKGVIDDELMVWRSHYDRKIDEV